MNVGTGARAAPIGRGLDPALRERGRGPGGAGSGGLAARCATTELLGGDAVGSRVPLQPRLWSHSFLLLSVCPERVWLRFCPRESVSRRSEGARPQMPHSHVSSWKRGTQPNSLRAVPRPRLWPAPLKGPSLKLQRKSPASEKPGRGSRGKGQKGPSLSSPLRCIQKAMLGFLGL